MPQPVPHRLPAVTAEGEPIAPALAAFDATPRTARISSLDYPCFNEIEWVCASNAYPGPDLATMLKLPRTVWNRPV